MMIYIVYLYPLINRFIGELLSQISFKEVASIPLQLFEGSSEQYIVSRWLSSAVTCHNILGGKPSEGNGV
jgi:hypothetical protein